MTERQSNNKDNSLTMDCRDVAALLSGLVDDEVDAQLRHRAERHIAGCRECAAKLDEAERINDSLITSIELVDALPDGFSSAVLSQTTRAQTLRFEQRRWVTWSGWLAAAAALFFAITLFYFESTEPRGNASDGGRDDSGAGTSVHAANYPLGRELRSAAVSGGYVPTEFLPAIQEAAGRDSGDGSAAMQARGETSSYTYINGLPVDVSPASRLSRDDEDTLYAAATVLAMLVEFDAADPRVAQRMREIVIYDELLQRLSSARGRVDSDDLPVVLAAESLLYRVANGPVDAETLREMRAAAASLKLPDRLDAMIAQHDRRNSMLP